MITIDGRCGCDKCKARTENIYRMIGSCYNCGSKSILMLFRAGDSATVKDCPVCGKWYSVHPQRLATMDEFPEAESALSSPAPPQENS
jgi:ssDNA-binding Zn-finger/Zn-ribbon topoisomerase 1